MKYLLLSVGLLFASFLITSCSDDSDDIIEPQVEFVIFDELKEFLPDGFNYSSGTTSFLQDQISYDLMDKLVENTIVSDFLISKGIWSEVAEKEGVKLWDLALVKPYLNEKELQKIEYNIVNSQRNFKANCQYDCVTVGYYCCTPTCSVLCPIQDCSYVCSSNTIILYEGNNLTQDIVGTIDADTNQSVNFTNNSCCTNDEARSATLWNMEAGQVITVYDNSGGSQNDDYSVINIINAGTYDINTFETNITTSNFTMTYFDDNGLDGKISLLTVAGN